MPSNQPASMEQSWGWVIVMARFLIMFILVGTYKCFGVLLDYYIRDLDATAAEAGGASVLFLATLYFTGPFFGVLADMHGPNGARIFIMIGGIVASTALCLSSISSTWHQLAFSLAIAGVGYGMVQVPTVAPLLMYFTNKFGLANGVSAAGGAVGMIVLPPLIEYWCHLYSWRGATVILGALSLNTTVAGALMRPPIASIDDSYSLLSRTDEDAHSKTTHTTRVKYFAITVISRLGFDNFCKHPRFLLYQFVFFLAGIQHAGWHIFLVPDTINKGINPVAASFLASIGGVGNFFGRGFNGPFLDHNVFSDTMLFVLDHLICAISLLLGPFAKTYLGMAVLAFWTGLTVGCSYAMCVVIAKNLVEEDEHIIPSVGWAHLSMGFGASIAGPIVGTTYDLTGHYYYGFLMMGGFELILTMTTFLELIHRRYKNLDLKSRYLFM